ncbi:hypothetical protein ACFW6K_00065 [Streptomyces sp. NPDC058733]|uniref:hypothetical protein n=1 Tax=unclassified Streptomyces TaxID=2593676 RepID=UPI003456CA37
MAYVRCPSPTCNDRIQKFRDLAGEEIAAAGKALADQLDGEAFVARAFHRCTAEGCRRVQRKTRYRVGGYLPEEFARPSGSGAAETTGC